MIEIKINDGRIATVIIDYEGKKIMKKLPPHRVAECILSNIKEVYSEEEEVFFPLKNTYAISKRGDITTHYLFENKKRGNYYLKKSEIVTYQIPYPNLFIIITEKNGKVIQNSIKVFALDNKVNTLEDITRDTKLYLYPFSHSYKDGGICWGLNTISKKEQVIKVLKESINGFHLVYIPNELKKMEYTYEDYLKHLETQNMFPERFLTPASGITVGSLFK